MAMGKFDDKSGQRFGELTAVKYMGGSKWLCECDCGESRVVRGDKLKDGTVTSCKKCNSKKLSPNIKDMAGMRFGRLTVIKYAGVNARKNAIWLCRCDCGVEKTVQGRTLRDGHAVSCGCYAREKHTTHHGYKERLFGVWRDMRNRCYNPNREQYKYYGAKGVRICDEWRDDYSKFREWALENGYDENAPYSQCTIDRINPFGDYEPSNCRWVDAKTQAQNRRRDYVRRNNVTEDTLAADAHIS